MQDTAGVGVVDPAGQSSDDPSRVLPWHGPVRPLQPIGERDPRAIRGHHVRHATRCPALMNRDDVGMTEPGGRLGLDGKPMPRLRVEPRRGVWAPLPPRPGRGSGRAPGRRRRTRRGPTPDEPGTDRSAGAANRPVGAVAHGRLRPPRARVGPATPHRGGGGTRAPANRSPSSGGRSSLATFGDGGAGGQDGLPGEQPAGGEVVLPVARVSWLVHA